MNLVQLKYFHAVCVYQSVSAAADYLHISQPSLSNAIKDLEDEFGVTLFFRHHRGMSLTEAGEKLFEMCGDLLSRADTAERVMNELGNKRNLLRLGVPPMIGSLVLPGIYNDFAKNNPDLSLEISESGSFELSRRLSDGFLDMIFLPHNKPIEKNLVSEKLGTLEIACCAAKDHPLQKKEEIKASDLRGIPLVLYKNGFYQTEEIKRWFSASGIVPNILLQTEQLSTIETIISSGAAVGFLFRRLIERNTSLHAITLKEAIYAEVSLVRKKDAHSFSYMKAFREYINKTKIFER